MIPGQLQFSLYEACRAEFTLPDNVFRLSNNVEVKRIRKLKEVDEFLSKYHYLHSGQSRKSIAVITRAYGLYWGGQIAGIIVFNPPGSSAISKSMFDPAAYEYGEYINSVLAMSRLVTVDELPFNGTGYLISKALKLLWQDNVERRNDNKAEYKTVVTFADTAHHSGTVYRSQNAWYCGTTKSGNFGGIYNPSTGEIRHVRQGSRNLNRNEIPEGWTRQANTEKLKYLFFLGDKKEKLKTMRRLHDNTKMLCKVGSYSVFERGKIIGVNQEAGIKTSQSYEEVYQLVGRKIITY